MSLQSVQDQEAWPRAAPGFICDEQEWRRPPLVEGAQAAPAKVIASRWIDPMSQTREIVAESEAGYHTISMTVKATHVALSQSGRILHDGPVAAGMFQVSGPSQPIRGIFHAPCDVLRLYVPNTFIAECQEAANERAYAGKFAGVDFSPNIFRDPVVEQLGRALLSAETSGGPFGPLYAEGVSLAIVARLLALNCKHAQPRTRVAALAKWRLRRATDYVDAHLTEAVSLADLASASGLTCMHFAAQFRAATGLRPHEYLLRRRIETAQDLLANTDLPLVEAALSVGFQTQAHFTTVFKRFVGQTPAQWRRANDGAA